MLYDGIVRYRIRSKLAIRMRLTPLINSVIYAYIATTSCIPIASSLSTPQPLSPSPTSTCALSSLQRWETSMLDTDRWSALQSAVAQSLRCRPDQLVTLHEFETDVPGSPLPRKRRKRTTGKHADPAALTLLCRTYRDFVCKEIAPAVASVFEGSGTPCTGIAFQANPSLRVVMPSKNANGQRHRDREYGHQPGQINYWIPLSKACGSNTLHVEGLVKDGGATALEGDFGVVHRFNGNELFHFTMPNDTVYTRVSLDFRVVPGQFYDNDYPGSRNEGNGKQAFFLGGYYAWADRGGDGVWTVRKDGAGVVRGNQGRK